MSSRADGVHISSCPWWKEVANSFTRMYTSPCLLLTYRSPYDENCRRKKFTDAVHTVVSMMIIGGKPTHGNVQIVWFPWWKLVANQIALSTFDEDCRLTYSRLLYIGVYDENWYVAHQLIHEMEIGVRSADSRKWIHRRSETEREKNPSLSSALRNSLSAMSPLRGSLALSRRKISRKTSGTRIAVNHFADDLKFIEQVVHTDGQGHSHQRFRGRLCSSLTACRTTKVVLRALRTYR